MVAGARSCDAPVDTAVSTTSDEGDASEESEPDESKVQVEAEVVQLLRKELYAHRVMMAKQRGRCPGMQKKQSEDNMPSMRVSQLVSADWKPLKRAHSAAPKGVPQEDTAFSLCWLREVAATDHRHPIRQQSIV